MCFMAVFNVSPNILIVEPISWTVHDERMMLRKKYLNDSRKGGPKR